MAVLAASGWFFFAEHGIAGKPGYPLDDSWIYATFARNLATGHGYSFNPGEHVGGATGPLYVFILALLYFLFRDVIWPAKILGACLLAAGGIITYFSAKRLVPRSGTAPLFAGLLVALSPSLLWGSLAGLEFPVYVFLACLGTYLYLGKRWAWAVLCWSIGVWLRPDGLVLVLMGLLLMPRISLRNAIGPASVAIVVLAAYLGFNFAVGGQLLPTSVSVKSTLGGDLPGREWRMVGQWLDLWGLPLEWGRLGGQAVFLLPAMAAGAAMTARKWPVLAVYVIGFPLAFGLFGPSGGQFGRYIAYVIPAGVLLAMVGVERLARRALGRRYLVGIILFGLACVAWQARTVRSVGVGYGWNVQNINGMHRFIAEATHRASAPGDTVAVNDVGAMGYFSGCRVVDLVGLVSPKRPFPENLEFYRPKLLIIFPDWFERYAAIDPRTDQVVFYDADSTLKYSPFLGVRLRRNTIASRNTMYLYERMGRDDIGASDVRLFVH